MTDEEDDREERAPFKRRVTLRWEGRMLRLPGEESARSETEGEGSDPPPSDELELPKLTEPPVPIARRGAPSGEREGFDGWQRQRQGLTPPPFRPPSLVLPTVPLGEADGEGDALSLVDGRSRPPAPLDIVGEMHDRYALGDYTSALAAAELVLGRTPDHPDAVMVSRAARERLEQLYSSRLGGLARTPTRHVGSSDVRWLGLDHRAGFLLSQVDGLHTYDELVDVSGMPRLEALKTFVELLDLGALRVEDV